VHLNLVVSDELCFQVILITPGLPSDPVGPIYKISYEGARGTFVG